MVKSLVHSRQWVYGQEFGTQSTVCVWSRVWYIVDSGCIVKSLVYSRQCVYGQEFGI